MVVIQKTGRKLVRLVVIVVELLLITAYCQNTSQVSVVEEDERELLQILQDTNFGFEIETNVQDVQYVQYDLEEEYDNDQFSTSAISLLRPDIEPSEIDLETPDDQKNTSSQTQIPESILQFADFVDQYKPQREIVLFETNLQQMLTQRICQKNFQNFGRTSFNAVGTIRVTLKDGRDTYCTGTLIGDNTVISSAECYQENAERFYYQPSWVQDMWLPIGDFHIPDKGEKSGTNNIAIFFLEQPLSGAPKIGFDLGQLQTQQCYITLLGWIFSSFGNRQYKMVTCPNLPDIEEQLGIKSKNCGQISCNLDDMDFQTGSPIILTCPNPIQHAVIGVLYMREDDQSKISLPFPIPKKFAFPYMFNLEDYLDIDDKVKTGAP